MNRILLDKYKNLEVIAGELTRLFAFIDTNDDHKSLWSHNLIWSEIKNLLGDNDNEFRYRVAELIYQLGERNGEKETGKGRRVGYGAGRGFSSSTGKGT